MRETRLQSEDYRHKENEKQRVKMRETRLQSKDYRHKEIEKQGVK